MPTHDSSSVVPPTPSTTRPTTQMSFPSGPQSPQLENNASPLSPIPTIYGLQSNLDHFVDDISDFEDSESDNDLSPILNAITTIPIPQNSVDAEDLITQARADRKSAIRKLKLADANFREAMLRAKLCRSRVRHAKQVLDATEIYLHHVNWTVRRSDYKDVWLKRSSQVRTVTDSGLHGTKVNHFVNVPGGSVAITLD